MEMEPLGGTEASPRFWRVGGRVGVLLGCIAMLNHAIEVFAQWGPVLSAARGVGMWVVTFLSFSVASALASDRLLTIPRGIAAAMSSAAVSSLILISFAVLAGYLASQPLSFSTVLTVGGSHLAQSLVVALCVATAAGGIAALLRSLHRRLVGAIAVGTVLLFAAGLGVIVHASGLERAARPPFIWLGVPALALSLSAVGPLVVNARRPAGRRRAGN